MNMIYMSPYNHQMIGSRALTNNALDTTAFMLNRVPSKAVIKTPYRIWTGRDAQVSFMRIWGCEAYVRRQVSDKLGPKSDKCYFIGYPKETKGYYFYIPSQHKVVVAKTGVFLERNFVSRNTSGSTFDLEEVQDANNSTDASMEIELEPQSVVDDVVPQRVEEQQPV